MNSQQISCFIEAARCKSFTLAAKHLYMSQPTLSRSIASLEKELGLSLFRRNAFHGIDLTESGTVMAEALSTALADIERATQKAQELERRRHLRLTLGLLEGQLLDDDLSDTVSRLRQSFPNLTVNIQRNTYQQLMGDLKDGTIDVICMPDWQLLETEGLTLFSHRLIPTVLAAPRRLAGAAEERPYSIREFAGLTFVSVTETECACIDRMMARLFVAAGIDPKVIQAQTMEEQIQLVEMGEGAILINPYNYICYSPNVSCFTVAELEPQPFSLAWRKDSTSESLTLLCTQLRERDKSPRSS